MLPPQLAFLDEAHIRGLAPGISGKHQDIPPADGLPPGLTGAQVALSGDEGQLHCFLGRKRRGKALGLVLAEDGPGELSYDGVGQPEAILPVAEIELKPPQHPPAHGRGAAILGPKGILIPMPHVL